MFKVFFLVGAIFLVQADGAIMDYLSPSGLIGNVVDGIWSLYSTLMGNGKGRSAGWSASETPESFPPELPEEIVQLMQEVSGIDGIQSMLNGLPRLMQIRSVTSKLSSTTDSKPVDEK